MVRAIPRRSTVKQMFLMRRRIRPIPAAVVRGFQRRHPRHRHRRTSRSRNR